MLDSIKNLDSLLRGERTRADQLASGSLDLPLRRFVPLAIGLGATYGFFMGWYALFSQRDEAWKQAAACMVKLPALFLFTLIVTFPSLYVFNALVGCRLRFGAALRLLVGAIVIHLAVGASLGPILAFFTLSTKSYPFMVLLNVALLGVAGFIGLGFLLSTLRKLAMSFEPLAGAAPARAENEPPSEESAAARMAEYDEAQRRLGAVNTIFRIWILIYALVGAQMGWLLRPFIGSPSLPFTFFRARDGNFFQSVWLHLRALME